MKTKKRVLDEDHWRFRLVEFTYGKDLPNYIYTKYCPLFWLSNLAVMILPITLFQKMFFGGLIKLINVISSFTNFVKSKFKNQKKIDLSIARDFAYYYVKEKHITSYKEVYEVYSNAYSSSSVTEEEFEKMFNILLEKNKKEEEYLERVKAETIERKKKRHAHILQLVIFSERFMKIIAYVGLVVLILLSVWFGVPLIIQGLFSVGIIFKIISTFIYNLFSMRVLASMWISFVLTSFIGYVIYYNRNKLPSYNITDNKLYQISGGIFNGAGSYLVNGLDAICEFVIELYSHSCPDIEIIEKKEKE